MPPIPKIPRVHLAYEIICSFEQNMYATVATPPAKIIGNSTIITKQTRCNKTDCLKKVCDVSADFFNAATSCCKEDN